MSSSPQPDFLLDILAQQPRINTIYTQLVFFFAIDDGDESALAKIITHLEAALDSLYQSFPWTSGQVVENEGKFLIRIPEQKPHLIVIDLRNDKRIPDWNTTASAQFPFKWLDEKIVAARNTMADVAELKTGLPVFPVQANIIHGGIAVSFNSQHGSMDMAGQAELISLFAKACRHEPYTASELAVANMDRRNIIPLLDGIDFEAELPKTCGSKPSQPSPQPEKDSPLTWAYFSFSANSLSTLKDLAMRDVEEGSFVSTDDTLSAFVWLSLCHVRGNRVGFEAPYASTLSRNVDARRFLSQPASYTGLLVTSTTHTEVLADLARLSLGATASQLRAAIVPEKLKRQLQVQASMIKQGVGDKYRNAATSDPRLDVRLSSWAKETCYSLDFGGALGQPDAIRTPSFVTGAREGLVYLLPKARNGDIVVGICLREDDMEVLKHDEQWSAKCSFIG